MEIQRTRVLFGVLGFAALLAVGGWVASLRIESPADVAARAAPPTPSPILVPVEERVLNSNIVTRGPVRIAPTDLDCAVRLESEGGVDHHAAFAKHPASGRRCHTHRFRTPGVCSPGYDPGIPGSRPRYVRGWC